MAVIIVTSIILIFLVALSFFGIALSQMTFFAAFPRTAAYGDPNKLRYIEMLDTIKNETMSYTVPHSAKAQAIRFFTAYRELMQRIHAHKMNTQIKTENK